MITDKISGLNLFQRLNFWVVKLGGAIMTTPPTLTGVETPSEATIVCNADTFTFALEQPIEDNDLCRRFHIILKQYGTTILKYPSHPSNSHPRFNPAY